jgi:hypothetical protein
MIFWRRNLLTVNLTTTYQRLKLCKITLVSLLMQTRLPDRIVVWVSKEPYLRDEGIANDDLVNQLVKSLPGINSEIISVRWVKNTGPYRKLIPMLREAAPEDIIVTADDDIFYGENWLKNLVEAYDATSNTLVAARVRKIKTNFYGVNKSYLYWKIITKPTTVYDDFVVTFGGGVALNRNMFREEDIFNEEYLRLAPTADDLWFSKLVRQNNTKVKVLPNALQEINFIEHNDGLNNHNIPSVTSFIHRLRRKLWDRQLGRLGVHVCGNDHAFSRIESYFEAQSNQK